MLNFGGSFTYANILGQNEPPTYKGMGAFGEAEYLIPFSRSNALSFIGTYQTNSLANTANDELIKESLKTSYAGVGLKLYFEKLFISLTTGKLNFKDTVRGETEKEITTKETAYELGVGYRFRITNMVGLIMSVHALRAGMDPDHGSGFNSDYEYLQYRAAIGVNIIIPSTGSKP